MNRPFFAVLALFAYGVSGAQTTYTLTQIGTNGPTGSTTVTGINDEGDLGLSVMTGINTAVYLWQRGTLTNLGGLAPSPGFVEGGALNDRVQVVGTTISPSSGFQCGFIWQHGQMTQLPAPAGSTDMFAFSVNLLGQVAGQAFDANFNSSGVLWDHGQATLLPGVAGGTYTQALGINIRGEVLGVSYDAANVPNTVVWRRGVLTVAIKGVAPNAINDLGQIVGSSGAPFVWQNGTTTPLPLIEGTGGTARAINDLGEIVGSVITPAGSSNALLWKNGTVFDLNTLVATSDPLQPYVHLQTGQLINHLGQIVATGTDSRADPGFPQNTYLLTPVR